MMFCPINIIGLLLLLGTGFVFGQSNNTEKLDKIIEYYKNLSDTNKNITLNGASTNLTVDQPKCELPLENPNYSYSAISPGEYNFYPRGGEYVEIFTILLVKCNYGFAGETFDKNIDDVVACENGTWSHKVECQAPKSQTLFVNNCIPSPCGPNSLCKYIGNFPVCSCSPGSLGSPPNCRPECTIDKECPSNRACINQICQDPCLGVCGHNATCTVMSYNPICACPDGHTGNPFRSCYPLSTEIVPQDVDPCNPSPCGSKAICNKGICTCNPNHLGDPYVECRPECEFHSECPGDNRCIRNKCVDPCPGVCGHNAICNVTNHYPTCNCPQGQFGDPYFLCKPECIINAECPKDKTCINNKCKNPCDGLCGKNALCNVVDYSPRCYCPPGQFGDPFVECIAECMLNTNCSHNKACIYYKCTDPCPGICGKNAICKVVNHIPVCNCPPGILGDPFTKCKAECEINAECPKEKACVNYKCIDPCLGSCGESAICVVVNHTPTCHCPPDSAGNPFIECRSENNAPVTTPVIESKVPTLSPALVPIITTTTIPPGVSKLSIHT